MPTIITTMQKPQARLALVIGLAALAILVYIFVGVGPRPDFVLPRRANQVLAMVLVAAAISYSSVIFQTITNNRILTPAVIGFESVYMFVQTAIVLAFSTGTYFITNLGNFAISIAVMMIFSLLIYALMFGSKSSGSSRNILFLLLVGMVMGTMFSSLTSYLQMIIDPSEFFIIQARMFASFNAINQDLTMVSLFIVAATIGATLPFVKYLDIMALGRENAISLGVSYAKLTKGFLIAIAVLVSVSTALVGPITFLGVLVANLSYQFIKTYKHKYILPTCMAITTLALVGGQYVVARLLNFSTTLSIVINFVGGVYFMYLLLKQTKKQM